jgi:hypothetical protein
LRTGCIKSHTCIYSFVSVFGPPWRAAVPAPFFGPANVLPSGVERSEAPGVGYLIDIDILFTPEHTLA